MIHSTSLYPSSVINTLLSEHYSKKFGLGPRIASQVFDRPCRARPADRSLIAEDRSAGGVRDRTGPKDAAAPPSRLANDGVVTQDEPHPAIELGASGTTVCQVNLTGRATSVPFTRVNVGSQRTTTDNTTAATTWAARVLRR
jgi:hypothetical protein